MIRKNGIIIADENSYLFLFIYFCDDATKTQNLGVFMKINLLFTKFHFRVLSISRDEYKHRHAIKYYYYEKLERIEYEKEICFNISAIKHSI